MGWLPTKLDVLLDLDGSSESFVCDDRGFFTGGKGLFIIAPEYVDPLIEDGLAENFGNDQIIATRLTEKGKAAVRLLKRESSHEPFLMPNWILVELTK